MKWLIYSKNMRRFLMCIIIALTCATNSNKAMPAPPFRINENDGLSLLWDLSSGDYEIRNDGCYVETKYVNGQLEVMVSTMGQGVDRDSFTVSIYKEGIFDLSYYREIAFDLQNLTASTLKLNFSFTDYTGREYRLTEIMPALALPNDSDVKEVVSKSGNSLAIPPSFDGEILIPDYGNISMILRSITSMGVSITVPRDTVQVFRMSSVKLIPDRYATDIHNFSIRGDTELHFPHNGESIAFYETVFHDLSDIYKEKDITFGVAGGTTGVSITKNGKLTVTRAVNERSVRIYADVNGEVRNFFTINLIEHRPQEMFVRGNVSSRIPQPNEISTFSILLARVEVIILIRLICIILSITLCSLYVWFRYRKRVKRT